QYSIKQTDIRHIETRICKFVTEYERIYYKYKTARLPACLSTIHSLLHIPHYLQWLGPLWAYWEFAMERCCGRLRTLVLSRVEPYTNLSQRA
ncbi:hypothetical protein BOTBODRAFT_85145, partial [Botryobasidium botryosum FD-172 SS1]